MRPISEDRYHYGPSLAEQYQLRAEEGETHICMPNQDIDRVRNMGYAAMDNEIVTNQRRPIEALGGNQINAMRNNINYSHDYGSTDAMGRSEYDLSDSFIRQLLGTYFQNEILRSSGLAGRALADSLQQIRNATAAQQQNSMSQYQPVPMASTTTATSSVNSSNPNSNLTRGTGDRRVDRHLGPLGTGPYQVSNPVLRSIAEEQGFETNNYNNINAATLSQYAPTSSNCTNNVSSTGILNSTSGGFVQNQSSSNTTSTAVPNTLQDQSRRPSRIHALLNQGHTVLPLQDQYPDSDIYTLRNDRDTIHFTPGHGESAMSRVTWMMRDAVQGDNIGGSVIVGSENMLPTLQQALRRTRELGNASRNRNNNNIETINEVDHSADNHINTNSNNQQRSSAAEQMPATSAPIIESDPRTRTIPGNLIDANARSPEHRPQVFPNSDGNLPPSSGGLGLNYDHTYNTTVQTQSNPANSRVYITASGQPSENTQGITAPVELSATTAPPHNGFFGLHTGTNVTHIELGKGQIKRRRLHRSYSNNLDAVPQNMSFVDAIWQARPRALGWEDVIRTWNRRQRRLDQIRRDQEMQQMILNSQQASSSSTAPQAVAFQSGPQTSQTQYQTTQIASGQISPQQRIHAMDMAIRRQNSRSNSNTQTNLNANLVPQTTNNILNQNSTTSIIEQLLPISVSGAVLSNPPSFFSGTTSANNDQNPASTTTVTGQQVTTTGVTGPPELQSWVESWPMWRFRDVTQTRQRQQQREGRHNIHPGASEADSNQRSDNTNAQNQNQSQSQTQDSAAGTTATGTTVTAPTTGTQPALPPGHPDISGVPDINVEMVSTGTGEDRDVITDYNQHLDALVRKVATERRTPFISPMAAPPSQFGFFFGFWVLAITTVFWWRALILAWFFTIVNDMQDNEEGWGKDWQEKQINSRALIDYTILIYIRIFGRLVMFYESNCILIKRANNLIRYGEEQDSSREGWLRNCYLSSVNCLRIWFFEDITVMIISLVFFFRLLPLWNSSSILWWWVFFNTSLIGVPVLFFITNFLILIFLIAFAHFWVIRLGFSSSRALNGILDFVMTTDSANETRMPPEVFKQIPQQKYSDLVQTFPIAFREEIARRRASGNNVNLSTTTVTSGTTETTGGDQSAALQCSICFADFEDQDVVIQSPCFQYHIFHADCIEDWWRRSRLCPLCREDIPSKITGKPYAPERRWRTFHITTTPNDGGVNEVENLN